VTLLFSGGPRRSARAVAVLLLSFLAWPAWALPSFSEVRAAYLASDAQLLARDGQVLQSQRIDMSVRRLPWTPLRDIAAPLQRAVILSEDKRFYEHEGVDWRAAGNAAWSNFWGGRTRGASTLSMQLAGLLEEDGQRRGRRSLFEKISQAGTAIELEKQWSKPQILEAYLNLVAFRGELQGIAAMSRGLFGKWPDGLDERESALAAALLRAPGASPAVVARRACQLLKDAQRDSECGGLEGFAGLALGGGLRRFDDGAQ
jgi:penicillin-binding protein 1C